MSLNPCCPMMSKIARSTSTSVAGPYGTVISTFDTFVPTVWRYLSSYSSRTNLRIREVFPTELSPTRATFDFIRLTSGIEGPLAIPLPPYLASAVNPNPVATVYEASAHRGAVLEPLRRVRWIPTGNVRTVSAANLLTGLYQNVLNVVLQRFVLSFGGGLTLLGLLQAFGGRFGLVSSLVQPVGGHLADLRGYGARFGIALSLEAVHPVLFPRVLVETREAAPPSATWRERIAQSVHPPREVRGLFLVVAMDAFAWGLAAGIIYGLASAEFHFTNTELASIAAVWALFFALFLPPTAAFVNRWGPRRCILFSEAIGVPIMAGWLVSSRPEHFVLVAVLNGLTAATWVPAIQTYISNWTSPSRRAGVLGSLAAFRGIAAFPAPFLGGLLYDHLGYAVPILANLVGAAVVTATIYVVLTDPPPGGVDVSHG